MRDSSDEERWITIVVAQARGTPVGREDAEFRQRYERAHPEIEEDAAFWTDLGHLGMPRRGARAMRETSETSEMDDDTMARQILAMVEPCLESQRSARPDVTVTERPEGFPRAWGRKTARRAVATMLAAGAIAVTLGVLAAQLIHHRAAATAKEEEAEAIHELAPSPTKPFAVPAPELEPAPLTPKPVPSHRESTMHETARADIHSPRDADALLKDAQVLVAAGRTEEAMAAYRLLLARYPRSPEARASLVSLGRLSLSADDAAPALEQFNRYLDGGSGPLDAEARYGRVRALRLLSRSVEERSAIIDFLARHDDSIYAEALRTRLAALSP